MVNICYYALLNIEKQRGLLDRIITQGAPYRYNTNEIQRRILLDYSKNNPLLKRVIAGECTIEGRLDELSVDLKGIKGWVPHRKDETHNNNVSELGDLIDSYYLRKDGIKFSTIMSKPLSAFVAIAGASFATFYFTIVAPVASIDPEIADRVLLSTAVGVGMISAVMTAIIGLEHYSVPKERAREQAQYMDRRIQQLFNSRAKEIRCK